MTKRILTLFAAIGGLTVLVVAFAALYSLRGQALGDLTRAQSPITGAQPAPAGDESAAEDTAGEAGEAAEVDEPLEDVLFGVASPFTAMSSARLDLVEEPGVVVSALVKNSAAVKAGVKRGDIVLAVDDQKVDDMRALTRALKDKQPGDRVALTIRHGDAERKLDATLGDQGGQAFLGIMPCGPGAAVARAVRIAGPAMHGAFVESVVADGPAAKAGLQDTDVITAVDGKPVDPDNDLAALIAAHKPGDTVVLAINRHEESREEAGGDDEDASTVTVEVKIEPIELSVVLGESPDTAGAAYLGLRYHAGGPMMWHEAMPGIPAVPAVPGEPMIAPLPRLPGDAGAEAGDVFFFSQAPGAEGESVPDGAFRFTHELPGGEGDPKVKLMFKAGVSAGSHAAPPAHPASPSKDV